MFITYDLFVCLVRTIIWYCIEHLFDTLYMYELGSSSVAIIRSEFYDILHNHILEIFKKTISSKTLTKKKETVSN